jgi:hypothetical protein
MNYNGKLAALHEKNEILREQTAALCAEGRARRRKTALRLARGAGAPVRYFTASEKRTGCHGCPSYHIICGVAMPDGTVQLRHCEPARETFSGDLEPEGLPIV